MATTTPNFGFDIPQSTDLVKDGATAIAALGTDIDTAFVDLKGGTTGQVLSKASNTDLDFTWVAQDDSNAIQNAIVDAKGDLISATAADTPARLAVGTNGQILTADSTTATGLKWADSTSGSYTLLSTTTISGASTTVSNISGSYTHLFVEIIAPTFNTGASQLRCWFNGNTTMAYYAQLTSNGSTVGAINDDRIRMGLTTSNSSAITYWTITLYNYAASTRKTFESAFFNGGGAAWRGGGLMGGLSTSSAITSFSIDNEDAYSFTGGTIKIYGVK